MRPILIYAGTTEGRRLSEVLSAAGLPCVVSVATEYGRQTMPKLPGVEIREGRMDAEGMRRLAEEVRALAVVDATHPFAAEATENIRASAECARVRNEGGRLEKIPYLRLLRATECGGEDGDTPDIRRFSDSASCVNALRATEGNILLTTGSKELATYAGEEALKDRLYVRVLPGAESIAICAACGIPNRQIIAMQGPFSRELNEALIRQFDIRVLVTKESGAAGGYPEKLAAAKNAGIRAFVIGAPQCSGGVRFGEVLRRLGELTQMAIVLPKDRVRMELVGIGMGGRETLTLGAKAALERADYIFGAPRMIADIPKERRPMPCYLAKDILPQLEHIRSCPEEISGGEIHIAVLFSGDTGFYSGARGLAEALERAGYANIRVHPGLSCVSYLAAAAGVSWQDAAIFSAHGKGGSENWLAQALDCIRFHERTFLLASGAQDVRALGAGMDEWGLGDCRVILGFQLSYPQEEIRELSPGACAQVEREGLYTCLICNPNREKRPLTHGISDERFLREKIPMTKEEIRETAISRLGLCEGDVVWDVGSGTGSVAAEIAARSAGLLVYAIEKKPEAAELIRKNCRKLRVPNVRVVMGEAPEILESLRTPDCAFIGGSGGALMDILSLLYRKNPSMRVVFTAVSFETAAQIPAVFKEFPVVDEKVVLLQASRGRQAGQYHLMRAESPVYIVSFAFAGEGSRT